MAELDSKATYWADAEPDKFVGHVKDRIKRFYTHCRQTGLYDLWRRSERLCYGLDADGGYARSSAVTFGGSDGEIAYLRGNHYGSIAQSALGLATGTRLSFQARAINTDYESQVAANLANGVVEYYYTERQLEERYIDALETMLFAGEGWIEQVWDEMLGELFQFAQSEPNAEGEMTLTPVYDGDVRVGVLHPIDVIRDCAREDMDADWRIVRRLVNRWDLMAQYPEFAELLRGVQLNDKGYEQLNLWEWSVEDKETDLVPVWSFYHRATPALPMGRQSLICGDFVLADSDLKTAEIPLIPLVATRRRKSAFGYARMWDLMAVQEAYDSVLSSQVTNHDATALVNFWTQINDDLSSEEIAPGVKHLQSMVRPEILVPPSMPATSEKLHDQFIRLMETISGVNAVARGNPPPSLTSGSALALVQSMAVEFNNATQKAFALAVAMGMTQLVDLLKRHATTPRVAEIVGKDERGFLAEFEGADLKGVQRVSVDIGAAYMRNTAGRVQIAEQLLKSGQTTPEQFMNVIRTGRLDAQFEGQKSERLNIKAENEMMSQLKQAPRTMATDNHAIHIQEHKTVLDNPKFRFDDSIAGVVAQHIQEHINLWMGTNPGLLMLTGQQPPDPMMFAGAAPGATPGGEKGTGPAPNTPGINDNQPEPGGQANMPNMPESPLANGGETQPAGQE